MNELTLANLALDLEMIIANRQQRRYKADRARNKDIIADYKEAVRRAVDQADSMEEETILKGLAYILPNSALDDRSPAEFNDLLNEAVRFLKREDVTVTTANTSNPFRTTTTKPREEYTREDFFR